MPAQTAYSINTGAAYEGGIADLQDSEVVAKLAEDSAISFGRVVSRGTADDQCVLGGLDPIGVSLRDLARMGAYDGAATIKYAETEAVSVLRRGWLYGKCVGGGVAGAAVKYNTTTGILGAGAPGSGELALPGATWEQTLANNAIGKVRLNGVNPTTVDSGS